MLKQKRFTLAVGLALAALGPGAVLGAERAEDGWRLSLADCLRIALENNLDLLSARQDPLISEQRVQVEGGTFDPNLSLSLSADRTEQAPVDPTQPSVRENNDLAATVSQELGFGADYSATVFINRNDAPGFNIIGTDDMFNPIEINPRYTSGLDLRFDMPLLRNRGKVPTQEQLLLRRSDLDISREELSRQAQLTIETTEGAYWDVLAGQAALDTRRLALKRAEDLLELNRKKVEVGTLAPIEITQAEAGVASNEELVIIAETELANAEDELRRLMAIPDDDPRWYRSLVLTDRPEFVQREIDVEAATETALEHRPEVATVREELRKQELSERAARNRVQHGFDLALRFRPFGDNDGSFPDPNPVQNPNAIIGVEEKVGDSLAEIFDVENYFWSAGVVYSLPIGNRAAKANLRIAELSTEKGRIAVRNQQQTIRVEVRAAVRAVESGVKRFQAASKNVELQEKNLEAEQRKFENGMSTSFEVLTFQEDLSEAELSLIQAQLDHAKALAALERSKGTLLTARSLRLSD